MRAISASSLAVLVVALIGALVPAAPASASAEVQGLPRLVLHSAFAEGAFAEGVFAERGVAQGAFADGAIAEGAFADRDGAAPLLAKKKKDSKPTEEKPEEEAVDEAPTPAAIEDEKPAEVDPPKEVKYGGKALGESVGGATGFVFKTGLYTQSDLGGFFRLGGYTDSQDLGLRGKAVLYSNLQPYIGLSVGYDVLQWLAFQVSFGTGFVANAAPIQSNPDSPRDYGMTFTNVAVIGSWYFLDRLALAGKLFGGGTFLTPAPAVLGDGTDAPFYGGNVGGGVGLRYATLLTDVVIGADVNMNVSFLPDGGGGLLIIPGISFAPVIKYVF